MTLPEVTPLLDGICASAGFRRSPRLQRFLRYVTEQAVRDPRQPLKEFQVATAEPLTTLACLSAFYEWDWERAEAGFKRALEIDPRYAVAHQW